MTIGVVAGSGCVPLFLGFVLRDDVPPFLDCMPRDPHQVCRVASLDRHRDREDIFSLVDEVARCVDSGERFLREEKELRRG